MATILKAIPLLFPPAVNIMYLTRQREQEEIQITKRCYFLVHHVHSVVLVFLS